MKKEISQGFTLVEMLVVIAIIAILIAMLFPAISGMAERGKVTQDSNNLRQMGIATQMYLNDNDNAYFLPTENWMKLLRPKYLANWKIFQSPFDKRPSSELDDSAPVSYGYNRNAQGTPSGSLLTDRITNPTVFILFAPAQNTSGAFSGKGDSAVTVLKEASTPGGNASGGTHNKRQRIAVCLADMHIENMAWNTFKDDGSGGSTTDKTAPQRWNPTATPAP